jgi:hypothetical protein
MPSGKSVFNEPLLGKEINTHTLAAVKPGDEAKFGPIHMFTSHMTTVWHGRKEREKVVLTMSFA